MPPPAWASCPYSRHFSHATGRYGVQLGWAELSEIIDMIDDLWAYSESTTKGDEKAGEMFAAVMDHLDGIREWTGWGGVPGKYTGAGAARC